MNSDKSEIESGDIIETESESTTFPGDIVNEKGDLFALCGNVYVVIQIGTIIVTEEQAQRAIPFGWGKKYNHQIKNMPENLCAITRDHIARKNYVQNLLKQES